ncbi:MAG: hypothetical protein OK404_00805 [Thaumarchaeota archaeon]|nr:hypothetical protein [Nitrososphaerota archaeon]
MNPSPTPGPPKRPRAVTAISILWTFGGLYNIYIGFTTAYSDNGILPQLSNPSVNPWFRFGVPAELVLYVLVLIFGITQLVVVFGLMTRKSWSYKLGLAIPIMGVIVNMSIFALYLSAPSELGLVSASGGSGLVVGLIWIWLLWKYLRRADVKSYLGAEVTHATTSG